MATDWSQLLAALALLLAVAAVVALAVVARRGAAERARQAETLQAMQQDLRALCNSAVAVGERINRAERRLQQLTERQEELGMRQDRMDQEDPEGRTYAQAVKLAHKGASVEQLMEVCGLTRGEAELIAMMHRLDQG